MNQAQDNFTSWIFILKPEILPGQFTIQLFRPDPRAVPNIILKEACRAFADASALLSTMLSVGLDGDTQKLFARLIEQRLTTRFAGIVPVEVLTWEELFQRAEKGEFRMRLMHPREMAGMTKRCRSLQAKVMKEIEREEEKESETAA